MDEQEVRVLGARDVSCAAHGRGIWTEEVSANTEASRARMKKKIRKIKNSAAQGKKVAKRWAFNVQQTLS